MARKARVKSSTGIYHVLVRAVSDISLFTDSEDITVFLQSLRQVQDKGYCTNYAYALFPTHVHLLISEGSEGIAQIMKRQAGSYSYYFNGKYARFGSIYMDRFQSEPIEDLQTFVSCLNFITTQTTDTKGILSNIIPFSANETLITNHSSRIESGPSSRIESSHFIDFKPKSPRITDLALKSKLVTDYDFSTPEEFLARHDSDQVRLVTFSKSLGANALQIARITGLTRKVVVRMSTRGNLTRGIHE